MHLEQRIIPFLTYKDCAEEAAQFYVTVLPDSKIIRTIRNHEDNTVLTVEFVLCGMKFVGLNAGQDWKFTEAFSLCMACDNQHEIDRLWLELIAGGGSELACGWLRDKFGMCWQIVPAQLQRWMASDKPDNLQRMFAAVWQMKKLNIAELERAFEGHD